MSSVFVLRQPVFDRKGAAVAYDLAFRETPDEGDAFARAYLSGSFDTLRDGLTAHVRVTARQLTDAVFAAVNPATCVLFAPLDLGTDPQALGALRDLASAGFTIGVDDYSPADAIGNELIALARLVRFDLRIHDPAAVKANVEALGRNKKTVIAEHVIDARTYKSCVAAGFDWFEGVHFTKPEPLPNAEVPTSIVAAIRVMALARDEETNDRTLEHAISADPAITFQLLRIVNSAAIGASGVTSIGSALRLVGRDHLVRWLALAAYSARPGKTGVDDEIVRRAVHRANFCEALARNALDLDPSTAYLVGMFSLLDAILRIPLADAVARVHLADDVRRALIDREGAYSLLITVTECYELGMWESAAEGAQQLGVTAESLADLNTDALRTADTQLTTRAAA